MLGWEKSRMQPVMRTSQVMCYHADKFEAERKKEKKAPRKYKGRTYTTRLGVKNKHRLVSTDKLQ